MGSHIGPSMPTSNQILSIDTSNNYNKGSSFRKNLFVNGSFSSGAGMPQESGSNPTNTVVQLINPGETDWVLRQNGANTEYQINLSTELAAGTTYVMSGWYSKSLDYNGADTMFHSRAFSTSGAHNALGTGLYNVLETRVVNGLTWQYCYAPITTPSDYSNSFNWYLGYGTTNTTGYRYYTNLKMEQGSFPSLYDSTGNGNHAFALNTSWDSSVGNGVLTTNASSTSYIETATPNLTSTNYTVIGVSRYSGATRGRMINGKVNNWLMGHWGSTTENYYAVGWVSAVNAGANDTNWRIYAATGDIAADQYQLYVNGVLTVSNTGGSQGPNGFTIGRIGYSTSEVSNGQFAVLKVYNRVLSADEIKQAYQSLRGRFGI